MTAPTSSTLNLIHFRFAIYKHYYEYARTISDSCCQYDKTFRSAARLVRFRMTNICLFPLSFHCRPTCTHVPARFRLSWCYCCGSVGVVAVCGYARHLCRYITAKRHMPQPYLPCSQSGSHTKRKSSSDKRILSTFMHFRFHCHCSMSCRCRLFCFFFFALKQKPNHKHYCSMNTDNFPFHLYIYMHCICFAWLETYTKNGVVRIKLMWLCKALDWIRGWMLWQNNTHNQYFSCFCIQKQMETSTTYAKKHKAFIFYTIHNAHDFSSIYSDAICRRNYTFYASTELV